MREVITSAKNPRVLYLQSLLQRKNREREQRYLIEGYRFIQEAIESGAPVEEIFLSPEAAAKNNEWAEQLTDKYSVTYFAGQLFKKFAGTENPQEIVALMKKVPENALALADNPKAFVVIIDGIQDPGNLGTIIRTADAAGATGIILTQGTVDLYNPKTLRATMGSLFHLPIVFGASLEESCKALKAEGVKVYAADVSKQATELLVANFSGPLALILGNEANGIGAVAREQADELVTIKMPGRAESLNAAIAAGILFFEVVRQRTSTEL